MRKEELLKISGMKSNFECLGITKRAHMKALQMWM
jgi:hypothetical protein